ncbi:MAG: L-threonylcarbamoyladenylate synthase [Pyrinomonadaceae bacterium]
MIIPYGEEALRAAAEVISAGGVIAFRTDTFYGLGADPFNRRAVSAVRTLKGRDDGKPILVVIGDESEAERFFASDSPLQRAIRQRHWPGPLTIVAPARDEVPEELTAGTGTIGVRLPEDEQLRSFIRACGGALTATSANLAGEPPARDAEAVARSFPVGLELIVDGGEARGDKPSTVLGVGRASATLIRDGAVTRRELLESLRTVGAELEG